MRVNKMNFAGRLDSMLCQFSLYSNTEEMIDRIFHHFSRLHGIGVTVEETESQTRYVFVKYPFEEHHEYELMSSRHECRCEMANYFLDKPCDKEIRSVHIQYILGYIERILHLPHWEDYLTEKPKVDAVTNVGPTPKEEVEKIINDMVRKYGTSPVVMGSAVGLLGLTPSRLAKHYDSLDAMRYLLPPRGCGKSIWVFSRPSATPFKWAVPKIKDVIFNDPATIVFWENNTKTVVKAQNGEKYDPEKGLAMAICKKALGDGSGYYETFKKFLPKEEKNPVGVLNFMECLTVFSRIQNLEIEGPDPKSGVIRVVDRFSDKVYHLVVERDTIQAETWQELRENMLNYFKKRPIITDLPKDLNTIPSEETVAFVPEPGETPKVRMCSRTIDEELKEFAEAVGFHVVYDSVNARYLISDSYPAVKVCEYRVESPEKKLSCLEWAELRHNIFKYFDI